VKLLQLVPSSDLFRDRRTLRMNYLRDDGNANRNARWREKAARGAARRHANSSEFQKTRLRPD
jgi:hypothetical protein